MTLQHSFKVTHAWKVHICYAFCPHTVFIPFTAKFDAVLSKLGKTETSVDIVDVCVLAHDKAANISDTANYKYAIIQ